MGKLNLIQGKWDGKVGQTVGAKWKNKATLRSYAVPSNPNTQAQQTVRTVFKDITSFVALFADQIKYLTSLNTRGQSVRNAIIQANKAMIDAGTFTAADLIVNKGGLPNATAVTPTAAANAVTCTFTKPVATNITDKAEIVVVVVDSKNKIAGAGKALLTAANVVVNVSLTTGQQADVYYWVIDYRGSARVGSYSGHANVTLNG